MNAREGFRRLGLVLGVIGFLGGAIAGYIFFDDIWQQRARYKAFSSLVNSPEVKSNPPSFFGGNPVFDKEHPSKLGIRVIQYDNSQDGKPAQVAAFEMEDGTFLYKGEGPTVLSYLLPFAFPIIGFLVPWGVIKLLVWVGAGFAKQT